MLSAVWLLLTGLPMALPLAYAATGAYAACLPSDASVECIGVYKERSTDVTKEDAKAAGIRWVEQPSFKDCTKAANYLRDARPQLACASRPQPHSLLPIGQ